MKAFTIKDTITNSYIGAIMINDMVFFIKNQPFIQLKSDEKVNRKIIY